MQSNAFPVKPVASERQMIMIAYVRPVEPESASDERCSERVGSCSIPRQNWPPGSAVDGDP